MGSMEGSSVEKDPQDAPVRAFDIVRFPGETKQSDTVVTEEPLEIRLNGESFAVLMRTPGNDRELVAGFLLSEGVIETVDDMVSLKRCSDPNRPNRRNVMQVRLTSGIAAARVQNAARRSAVTASCGVCGKASIESVMLECPPLGDPPTLTPGFIASLGATASATQRVFAETGGLHGAVLITLSPHTAKAELIRARAEDVGRHNAVDKVIGTMLLAETPPSACALWVSGRAGFEVVQKALMASIPVLVAVGAPTSLAVELARSSGLTLIGFARAPNRFNVYSGAVTGWE